MDDLGNTPFVFGGALLKAIRVNSKNSVKQLLVDRVEALDDFVHNYSTELELQPEYMALNDAYLGTGYSTKL